MYKEKIKNLRYEKKLKQENLAQIINVHRGRYSQYENESDTIPINHLNTICNYFNVSLDYVFSFTNKKNYNNYKNEIDNVVSGQRLKEVRKSLKLSQTEFGDRLGCSYGTIAGYEKGRYTIATPFLYDICKRFKISSDYLLGKVDEPRCLD